MARLTEVLSAVARSSSRRAKSFRHISGNNMFYAGMAFMFLMDPAAMMLFLVLIGIIVFLPSSADPMTAIPRDRLLLWPLTRFERWALRIISPLLNPLAWVILGGLAWRRITWGLWAAAASLFLSGFLASAARTPIPWIPPLQAGRLTHLLRKDLRQLLTALDLYCALLLAVPAGILRMQGKLPPDADMPLTALITVVISTMPLTLFGLDGDGGKVRHRLWPDAAWLILLSKGIAYLLIVVVVNALLSPVAGLAGGITALAIGQWHSIRDTTPQTRWRFRASHPFAVSIGQMVASVMALGLVTQVGWGWLAIPSIVYVVSLAFCVRLVPVREVRQ